MPDTFDLDPKLTAEWAAQAERAKDATGQTRDYMSELNKVLVDTARAYAEIERSGKALNLPPEIMSQFRDVYKSIDQTGKGLQDAIQYTARFNSNIKDLHSIILGTSKSISAVRLPEELGNKIDALSDKFKGLGKETAGLAKSTQDIKSPDLAVRPKIELPELTAKESGLAQEVKAAQDVGKGIRQAGLHSKDKNKHLMAQVELTKKEGKEGEKITKGLASRTTLTRGIINFTKTLLGLTEKEKKEEEGAVKPEKKKVRTPGYTERQVGQVTQTFAGMAGLGGIAKFSGGFEISLSGIIKKIFDIYNKTEKVSGYAKQAAAQFGSMDTKIISGSASISVASRAALDLRAKFGMAFEEAGKMTVALTQAGFEAGDMGKMVRNAKGEMVLTQGVASRMLGVQYAQGRQMTAQVESIMNLRNNFSMMISSAQTLDALIGHIGKNIPGLSPQQAVVDVEAMATGMRYFNTEILDSLTLYKSLQNDAEEYRKSVEKAKKDFESTPKGIRKHEFEAPESTSGWGEMVKAPLQQRQALLQWMSQAPMSSEWGTKAALGKGPPGGGATGAIGEFMEAMKHPGVGKTSGGEFLERVISKVEKMVAGSGKDHTGKMITAVELLTKVFGMPDKELAQRIGEQIVEGKWNAAALKKLTDQLATEKVRMEAAAKKQGELANNLVDVGSRIAKNLLTVEQKMAIWVDDKLFKPMLELKGFIGDLTEGISILNISQQEAVFYEKIKALPKAQQQEVLAKKKRMDEEIEQKATKQALAPMADASSWLPKLSSKEEGVQGVLKDTAKALFTGVTTPVRLGANVLAAIYSKIAIQNEKKLNTMNKMVDENFSKLTQAQLRSAQTQEKLKSNREADQIELDRIQKLQDVAAAAERASKQNVKKAGSSPIKPSVQPNGPLGT